MKNLIGVFMTLFRLDASIFPATSATRALGDIVEEQWSNAHPDSPVTRRDIAGDPIPATAWQNAVTAGFVAEADQTDAQGEAVALAAALADELIDSDALLLNVPLYNFGVSQHFRTWFDLALTDPRIGVDGTALRGKPTTLVTSMGGNYGPGSPKAGWNHSTPWLRRVLADAWGLDLRVVERPFTLVGVNPALDAFTDVAAALKDTAETDARDSGQQMAALRGKLPVV